MFNKRGQGLSINAIILIILGVVVLVILIAGFTMGWGKVAPWISSNNVDTIVTACGIACSTDSQYDFCSVDRVLKDAEGKEVTASCFELSKDFYSKYDIKGCSSVDCSGVVSENLYGVDEVKKRCTRVSELITYIDAGNNLENSYSCQLSDLPRNLGEAQARCFELDQYIEYSDTNGEFLTYVCREKDIPNQVK